MKYKKMIFFLSGLFGMMMLNNCRNGQDAEEAAVRSVTPVTVCSPRTGIMAEYAELTATSSFLVKAVIKSSVSGYVEKCGFSPGDHVAKNEVLFQLRTRESAALQNDSLNLSPAFGLVQVRASIEGVVSALEHSKGDYVQEGDALCTLVLPESLVFLLDVPFELKTFVSTGSECILMLPGNVMVKTVIKSVLPSMSELSQTQRVILKPLSNAILPENLIARVKIVKSLKTSGVILPKSCILSDEVMKQFWVMKLINDTLAVKVSVTIGIIGKDSIDVVSPGFAATDRILTSGNYGIGDTAVVRIIKQ
jgi:hypothetical protein